MERYRNSGGDLGVSSFEIGADYINVKFPGSFGLIDIAIKMQVSTT